MKAVVVLWAPSRTCGQELQKKTAPKVQQIADLAGHRVGVIGLTQINVGQLLASLRKLNHRHVMNIDVSPVGPTAQIRFKSPKQLIFP